MPLNSSVKIAAEALEVMGFEDMSDLEPGHNLCGYWLTVPPYTKVLMQDHEWTEQRHLMISVLRQLDTDEQKGRFQQLTGW